MGPHFPTWIRTQGNLLILDLSSNDISCEVPNLFCSPWSPVLRDLNLSQNHYLSGTIPHLNFSEIFAVDVSSNNFSGHIPSFHPDIETLQISQNMFSGSISSLCTRILREFFWLDLSNNQLIGELPNCWENMSRLIFLNLASNKLFFVEIPHTLGSLSRLHALHLRNNNLSWELPSTFKNCTTLELMDIEGNMLTGNIPSWIGAFSQVMTYIILNENRFYGSIPLEICRLTQIKVLDLSINNLSGHIPQCFHNFAELRTTNNMVSGSFISPSHSYPVVIAYRFGTDYALVQWKGQESKYQKNLDLLKLIDLSSNKLVGDIPVAFLSLNKLISLNLSRNSLTGNINEDIRQMERLEVLDLSSNQLSGTIPIIMAQLNSLAVLYLAKNNLSSKIPLSTQLQSFNESSYAGNLKLCGAPLVSCSGDKLSPNTTHQGKRNNKEIKNDEDKGGFILMRISFWKEVGISIVFNFIFGFWGLVGSLLIKRSWRVAYFNFWGRVGDWFYVTIIVFFRKLRRT